MLTYIPDYVATWLEVLGNCGHGLATLTSGEDTRVPKVVDLLRKAIQDYLCK
jgi:hypothetical protein